MTPSPTIDPVTRSRRLVELRAPELLGALDERSIIVQPLGAIEQHGPHLPFNTDLVVAEAVSAAGGWSASGGAAP